MPQFASKHRNPNMKNLCLVCTQSGRLYRLRNSEVLTEYCHDHNINSYWTNDNFINTPLLLLKHAITSRNSNFIPIQFYLAYKYLEQTSNLHLYLEDTAIQERSKIHHNVYVVLPQICPVLPENTEPRWVYRKCVLDHYHQSGVAVKARRVVLQTDLHLGSVSFVCAIICGLVGPWVTPAVNCVKAVSETIQSYWSVCFKYMSKNDSSAMLQLNCQTNCRILEGSWPFFHYIRYLNRLPAKTEVVGFLITCWEPMHALLVLTHTITVYVLDDDAAQFFV